jgi:hypothetical protein
MSTFFLTLIAQTPRAGLGSLPVFPRLSPNLIYSMLSDFNRTDIVFIGIVIKNYRSDPVFWRPAMQTALRIVIATILIAAAGAKIVDPAGFVLVLRSYRFFPVDLVWPAALAIMATELLLGLWLLWGRQLFRAALAAVGLHLTYSAWTAFMLLRGKPILNCGCFGSHLARPLSWLTFAENLVLVALSVALLLLCQPRAKAATGGHKRSWTRLDKNLNP